MVSCLLNFRPVVRFSVFGSKCISWRKIFVFIMCLKLFFFWAKQNLGRNALVAIWAWVAVQKS